MPEPLGVPLGRGEAEPAFEGVKIGEPVGEGAAAPLALREEAGELEGEGLRVYLAEAQTMEPLTLA
jgi:hypothetical protein